MKINKKPFSIIAAVMLLFSLFTLSSAAGIPETSGPPPTMEPRQPLREGFGNFVYTDVYIQGQFADVPDGEWYAGYVADAFNYGFISGRSETLFAPLGMITLGEAVTLAVKLGSVYHTGCSDFELTEPYYMAYAQYALEHGFIDKHMDYDATATRAQFAGLFYNSMPASAFPEINIISAYGINDVMPDAEYGAAIYALYRAGVLAGSDQYGTFYPDSYITRAEACALMVRLAVPAFRINTKLPDSLPADVIYRRSAGAVIMIETFDSGGNAIRTGSAFVISAGGYAVTCLHVIENAANAVVRLSNGEVYPVRGVNAINHEANLIVLSIDSDRNDWDYLLVADSSLIVEGNAVYTIGSPRSLINTMTGGVVSKTVDEENLEAMFQFTAPISFGSGGSPVLNGFGQVVGIASSSYSYGQNLNLAIPANHIRLLDAGESVALEDLLQEQE